MGQEHMTTAQYRQHVQDKLQRVLDAGFRISSIGRAIGVSRQRISAFARRGVLSADKIRELDHYLDRYDTETRAERVHANRVADLPTSAARKKETATSKLDAIGLVCGHVAEFISLTSEALSDDLKVRLVRSKLEYVYRDLLPEAEREATPLSNPETPVAKRGRGRPPQK